MPAIRIENLSKTFDGQIVVDDLSLEVGQGSGLALVGPSGCGKTTVLRIVAGLEQPDAGRVLFDDRDVTGASPEKRDLNMVFQDGALWPHMRVAAHLDFVLRGGTLSRDERKARVASLLELVQLADRAHVHPAKLSGGEQQRLAIARALATNPSVLLLDEPFAHLDDAVRDVIVNEIARRQRDDGITVILASHDHEDFDGMASTVFELPGASGDSASRS
jgi:ABC-type Fe3+/spermidine/putrescine transport system ATPase subunit